MKVEYIGSASKRLLVRRTALAAAVALGFGIAGNVSAQATTGGIYGTAPAVAGETIVVQSTTGGLTREDVVDSKGRYSFSALPVGTYTVSLRQNGATVDGRNNVEVNVGSNAQINFQADDGVKKLATVTVNGNAQPAIDVTTVDSHTVITSAQLAKLPLARTAEAIALLAPGVTPGSAAFSSSGPLGNSLDSFGGSSVTENAYYINGFNTTDPLSGFGGIELPYGAIDQQEIMNGGYSAAYGRSDGGVISQTGKRGTNDWHFGFQLQWTPGFTNGDMGNSYYVNGSKDGQIYRRNSKSNSWEEQESAYVGGPLIKDKLFFFAAMESDRIRGNSVGAVTAPYNNKYEYENPKWYAKVDWNITDNNILEFTGASNKHEYQGNLYNYDYDTGTTGAFNSYATYSKTSADLGILKFTSYITDDLTLTAQYGKQKIKYYTQTPGADTTDPYISGTDEEDPSITGGSTVTGKQTVSTVDNPDHKSTNTNLRVDLTYKLGDHSIQAGIDNQDSHDVDDGTSTSGPGYEWIYAHGDADTAISTATGAAVAAPGGNGYYVDKDIYSTSASVRVKQRAEYIEDTWQVSDRWLVKLGIRNDSFTNYNPSGAAFLRLTKPQWAPRIGASWDVHGDASLKVYANAGRYYLAMPASVALRAAAGSTYTDEYYTYTGISSEGVPTGLTQIASSTGGAVSADSEYGQSPDPKTVAAQNIKSEYQDEYILGFTQQINKDYVWGMKAQVRKLRNILDDICDADTLASVANAEGYTNVTSSDTGSCYLSNPGRSNTYNIVDPVTGAYDKVTVSASQFGDPKPKRNYYAIETFLEHPFDGKWAGRIDYVWSRSLGNTEGQVRSDISQTDVSATVDWDYGQLMQYSGGKLANDRPHQLKAYGSYQITPEWMVSGNIMLMSGTPKSCLGYYGTDESNPTDYGSYYHWCGGKPSRPGDAGRTPWQHIVSVSAEYRPAFADHKLAFNLMIYNLLNESVPTQYYAQYGYSSAILTNYMRATYWSTPRYLRFSMSYDF